MAKNGNTVYLLTVDGAALTVARVDRGLDQQKVAEQVGVNKSTVCRWEQGFTQPSQPVAFALVELLGTDNFVRLNGKAVLTAEEIEVVRKLREG
jgi:DNA-binding XRE family transcriptional regulator